MGITVASLSVVVVTDFKGAKCIYKRTVWLMANTIEVSQELSCV